MMHENESMFLNELVSLWTGAVYLLLSLLVDASSVSSYAFYNDDLINMMK